MKVVVVLAMLVVLAAAQTTTDGPPVILACPPEIESQCPDSGNVDIPLQHNCEDYCACEAGVGHIEKCGPGTMFDAETLTCVPPEDATCLGHP